MNVDARPERSFAMRWLPPGFRPPEPVLSSELRVLGLVGVAALIAAYDMVLFGLAAKIILADFGLSPEDAGPTISLFRLGAIPAFGLALFADIVGRRRLLLITIVGSAVATLATAFAPTYETFVAAQFVVRVFGYAEDMLCVVVVAEEFSERKRGWAVGGLGSLAALGQGLGVLVFAAVNVLPFGWRAMYVIGAVALLLLAWFRRKLPETRRFQAQGAAPPVTFDVVATLRPAFALAQQYPGRMAVLASTVILYAFGIAPANVLLATYAQAELGVSPPMVSFFLITSGLIAIFGNLLAGAASDRFGRRATLIAVTVALVLANVGLYTLSDLWVFFALLAVGNFCAFAANVLLEAFGAELFPTSYRATASALRFLFAILSGAVSLALHGWLAQQVGFANAVLILLIPLPFAILPVLMLPETAMRRLEDIAPERG